MSGSALPKTRETVADVPGNLMSSDEKPIRIIGDLPPWMMRQVMRCDVVNTEATRAIKEGLKPSELYQSLVENLVIELNVASARANEARSTIEAARKYIFEMSHGGTPDERGAQLVYDLDYVLEKLIPQKETP